MAKYEISSVPHIVGVSDPLMGKKAEFHIDLKEGRIRRKSLEWQALTDDQRVLWRTHHGQHTNFTPLRPHQNQKLTESEAQQAKKYLSSVLSPHFFEVVRRYAEWYVVGSFRQGEVLPAETLYWLRKEVLCPPTPILFDRGNN